jgi:hypothetical protein
MATITVLDSAGLTVAIEKPLAPGRAADTASRPVALSTQDKTVLDSIDTKLTTLAGYVDGLEALANSLNGYVDGIEALIGATNTSLATLSGYVDGLETLNINLNGYVDGLETLVASTNTKLDTLHTDIATTLIGYVDGLETLQGAISTKLSAGATTIAKAEDVASADADVGVPAMAVRKAAPANTSGTDGDYEMLQMSAGRLWASVLLEAGSALIGRAVADASAATGGIASTARLPSAAASTNATNVKTSGGRVYSACGKNNSAYDVFLVFYDSAANPPVPGTTAIRKKVPCPAGQAFVYDFPLGLSFATGIGYAFTKLVADADTTVLVAADITAFNLDYV